MQRFAAVQLSQMILRAILFGLLLGFGASIGAAEEHANSAVESSEEPHSPVLAKLEQPPKDSSTDLEKQASKVRERLRSLDKDIITSKAKVDTLEPSANSILKRREQLQVEAFKLSRTDQNRNRLLQEMKQLSAELKPYEEAKTELENLKFERRKFIDDSTEVAMKYNNYLRRQLLETTNNTNTSDAIPDTVYEKLKSLTLETGYTLNLPMIGLGGGIRVPERFGEDHFIDRSLSEDIRNIDLVNHMRWINENYRRSLK